MTHRDYCERCGTAHRSVDCPPVDQLADVIREAVTDFAAKKIGHVVHGGPTPPDFNDHIAAAVQRWLASEAVVERAAEAIRDAKINGQRLRLTDEYATALARAALAAAGGRGG